MKEMKCGSGVEQRLANSAIMIPVADQFELIYQEEGQGAASYSRDCVNICRSAQFTLPPYYFSEAAHSYVILETGDFSKPLTSKLCVHCFSNSVKTNV